MPEDYAAFLKRARSKVPEKVGTGERFVMPQMDVLQEGKLTIVRNMAEVLDRLNRPSDHLVPILLREVGTAGSYEDGRLTLQAKVSPDSLQTRLEKYVETYVICGECGRPDTHLMKEERTTILKCDACGAHRPIKGAAKKAAVKPEEAVVEGKTYEVMIEDNGKRGDGIARRDRYTIFVKGAQKGNVYHVKIEKVTGTLAFGEIVSAAAATPNTAGPKTAAQAAAGNKPASGAKPGGPAKK
ncbi:MAG: translation initiation factor 2 subunit 2 [Thermoplasmata archaeon]|nr:translation initiation factor 2 subunit 2 [Thermoplasmata archaeon]